MLQFIVPKVWIVLFWEKHVTLKFQAKIFVYVFFKEKHIETTQIYLSWPRNTWNFPKTYPYTYIHGRFVFDIQKPKKLFIFKLLCLCTSKKHWNYVNLIRSHFPHHSWVIKRSNNFSLPNSSHSNERKSKKKNKSKNKNKLRKKQTNPVNVDNVQRLFVFGLYGDVPTTDLSQKRFVDIGVKVVK